MSRRTCFAEATTVEKHGALPCRRQEASQSINSSSIRRIATLCMPPKAFGVSKSVDGGLTWTRINTGLTGIEYQPSLSIDRQNPATLYYTGVCPHVTRNGGMTWSRVSTLE